jgi:hypothetical protein
VRVFFLLLAFDFKRGGERAAAGGCGPNQSQRSAFTPRSARLPRGARAGAEPARARRPHERRRGVTRRCFKLLCVLRGGE